MTSLEKDCDRLLQQVVVERDKVCVRCRVKPAACGHHIFTRSRPATRYRPDAVIGVCAECHNYLEEHPAIAREFAISFIGYENYNILERLSLAVCRFRAADFREIRQELRMMIGRGE